MTDHPRSIRTAFLLLPGFELDEFPKHLEADQAEALLSGWIALWHPALIRQIGGAPAWKQASANASEFEDSLILVPEIAKPELTFDPASVANCVAPPLTADWSDMQQQLLGALDIEAPALAPILLDEFAALGYAYLQIQLMTRQLRYTSSLDESLFSEKVLLAAEAAYGDDLGKCQDVLQSCFDTLGQERDHYYSLDVNLVDVTLLASTTLGNALREQLGHLETPTTLLASGSLLSTLHEKQSETFELLKKQIDAGIVSLAGGLDSEHPHPLLPRESFRRDLAAGATAYAALGLHTPHIFARMSFGLNADDAAILRRHGFEGVLLIAWSEGHYPVGNQAKISWESSDGTFISALAAQVFDASDASSYLALGWYIGDALDHQHVPTILLAHWPNRTSRYFRLLQVIAQKTPALGKWSNSDNYFRETDDPYHQERLGQNGFRFNWLVESANAHHLIQNTTATHKLGSRCRSLQNLANLVWQLENRPCGTSEDAAAESSGIVEAKLSEDLQALHQRVDAFLANGRLAEHASDDELVHQSDQIADALLARLKRVLVKGEEGDQETGRLIVNLRTVAQRTRVQSDKDRFFQPGNWNFSDGRVGHDRYTNIDVPGHGFVVAAYDDNSPQQPRQQHLAEVGGVIQNEFLEAQVDNQRGHLRSLHVPGRRGNRLSLMLARRDLTSEGPTVYSEMRATDVRMLTSSNICGLVRATGRLELDGQKCADFEMDYEVWRGSRIIEIVVRLSNMQPLADSNPWRSAYILRLAWPSEAALLRTFNVGRRHAWPNGRTLSPTLIEIDESDYCTHYLPGGLAFHRRTESRFLETVLVAPGFDAAQSFEHRVGIAVDLPQPLESSFDFIDRRYSLPLTEPLANASTTTAGWLVNCDTANVIVDLESPLTDSEGRNRGVRLFVTECKGKSTNARVRLMHNVQSAARVDFQGKTIGKLTAAQDHFSIALRANEQCAVDVLWAE